MRSTDWDFLVLLAIANIKGNKIAPIDVTNWIVRRVDRFNDKGPLFDAQVFRNANSRRIRRMSDSGLISGTIYGRSKKYIRLTPEGRKQLRKKKRLYR